MKRKILLPFMFLSIVFMTTSAGVPQENSGVMNKAAAPGPIVPEEVPPLPPADIPGDTPDDSGAVIPELVNDEVTDNAAAIRKAVSSCAERGGIVALKCGGVVLSSPLILKSNVYLKIENGTTLKAVPRQNYPDHDGKPAPFISADGAEHTGIFGGGIIDGNGEDWWTYYQQHKKTDNRVQKLIYFSNCTGIIVRDITIRNATKFNLQPARCKNVVFYNITIRNPSDAPNTDGIDPSSSDTVFIDHCDISTGDDNIAVKSSLGPCKNIYITHCVFGTGHGLSIGSETNTGVSHMLVRSCTFNGGDNGIRIKTPRGRGGIVRNLQYSDIVINNIKKYPFEISAYYPENTIPPSGSKDSQPVVSGKTPQISDILLQDVSVSGSGNRGGCIIGLPESPVYNVQLVHFTYNSDKPLIIRNAQVVTAADENGDSSFVPEYTLQENAHVYKN